MMPLIHFRKATLSIIVLFSIACFGLAPLVWAVIPPPDSGYPGGNTAEGQNALFSLTSGGFNTAVGFSSLRSNSIGGFNTAVGAGTLFANTAEKNTATGAGALLSNTIGFRNTANGNFALLNNTEGADNTAIGGAAMFSNTTGSRNTANGIFALQANTAGNVNTAIGDSTLFVNTTGNFNTAIGGGALVSNTVGHDNTAVGLSALLSSTTGSNNTALGSGAGLSLTAGDNNIFIGNPGDAALSGTIFIGNPAIHSFTVIAGIFGAPTQSGIPVYIDANHRLGTTTSSRRFKEDIKPMNAASEAILTLKPVTFRYKKELDPKNIPQFGLVAEDVERVNSDLVVRDKEGKPYSVRYDQVNAMLLNEFLKEHRTVENQESRIQQQAATIARQQKQIDALTAGLQRVSDQLALSKSAPRAVISNQ
jgi:hypothetical protein